MRANETLRNKTKNNRKEIKATEFEKFLIS